MQRTLAAAVLGVRASPVAIRLVLAAGALAAFLAVPVYPDYDSTYALLWGRDLLHGTLPDFNAYRAPVDHPLWLAAATLFAALGDIGARLFAFGSVLSLVALAAGVYQLGRRGSGWAGALLAGALVLKFSSLSLAARAFLDFPFCALVVWAAVLEANRPRRGGVVWALLVLAGLLRPEAWLIAGVYALWTGWRASWTARARAVALAAGAPVLWCLVDLALTGDPLFSFQRGSIEHFTAAISVPGGTVAAAMPDAQAATGVVGGGGGSPGVAALFARHLVTIATGPGVAAAVVGIALAVILRRRTLAVPGALVVVGTATYLAMASASGFLWEWRFALLPAVAMLVFAGFALGGWTTLPRGAPWRRRWAAASCALLGVGLLHAALLLSSTNPLSEQRDTARIRGDLRAVLSSPAVVAARRCGPISVPNHKLIPHVRWMLGLPDGAVLARSNRSRPPHRHGVAIAVDWGIAGHPLVNVFKGSDAAAALPPAGFHRIAGNGSFTAWGRC